MGSQQAKNVIVGTAGHVDHGKTTLIKAMTGIDTDRLKEEQERGLTIDLGFASLDLESGRRVGIVDVPGHEKFLKNMLAGASGIDIALLVVAADEGVMPQTSEHLEILELLETKQGIVALTKCDVVDEELIEIVREDLEEALADTFLAGAKIIRASGVTGEGVDEICREIDRLADLAESRSVQGPFRLPVDRAFTMTGFGTVVTGTLVSGTLRLGDPVRILPQGIDSRVRQIQVHGRKQDEAQAGTRTAVNLAGVGVDELERGSVIVPPGYLEPATGLDVWVRVLPESNWPLKTRTRVRLHVGTAEVIGRCAVLEGNEIAPGESGFVQLKLETPVVAARGDRFVLRLYSPTSVMGGGLVLDPAAAKRRRKDASLVERLKRKLKGDPADMVDDALSLAESGLVKAEIARRTGLNEHELDEALAELESEGRVLRESGRYLQKGAYESLAARVGAVLRDYHAKLAMRTGMPKEELRAALGPRVDAKGFQAVLAILSSGGGIVVSESTVRLPEHEPTLTAEQRKVADAIEREFRESGVNPPLLSDLSRHGSEASEVLKLLVDKGVLVKISPELCFHREAIDGAEKSLRDYLGSNGEMTVSQFRDAIGSSRKYVVPLLEYFDRKRITRRSGDIRTLMK